MSLATMTYTTTNTPYYAKCIEAAEHVRWDIDEDVIRGRSFDFGRHFMPEGLSLSERLDFLDDGERRRLSQVQGRSYANMAGLMERFICIKMMELCRDHWFGDQVALAALVGFTHEELKHQELFRRADRLMGMKMPQGYEFMPTANVFAAKVMGASSWAALALVSLVEMYAQVHHRFASESATPLCELYKDMLLFHWKEESHHVIVDELEWERANRRLNDAERDKAVGDFCRLIGELSRIVHQQAEADAQYFLRICGRELSAVGSQRVARGFAESYRWQYIGCGLQDLRFNRTLSGLTTTEHRKRIQGALQALAN